MMRVCVLLMMIVLLASAPARAQSGRVAELAGEVGIDQKLDSPLPLDLVFRDESGAAAPLKDYFGERPVVLMFVQYECPMLCTVALDGLVRSLRGLNFSAGEEFVILTVSFDPDEGPELARRRKRDYLRRYGREGAEHGWHFLTSDEPAIRELTDAAGFRYTVDPVTGNYAHAAGLIIATPQGRTSRYFYGIDHPPRDLRLGLVEASAGRVGSVVDQVLLLCYRYDPYAGKYNFAVDVALKVAGLATVFVLAAYIVTAVRRERRAAEEREH